MVLTLVSCTKKEEAKIESNTQVNEIQSLPSLGSISSFGTIETATEEYEISFIDNENNPISGVMFQVCDDSVCHVFTSDENGKALFSITPKDYELHFLIVPEEYNYDKENAYLLKKDKYKYEIKLTKI